MAENYSIWQRNELKQKLIRTRIPMAIGGWGFDPICGICEEPLISGCDMHEGIITRGDIRGQKHLTPYIMVEPNCALVCPGGSGSKCHSKAETKEGKIIIMQHILQFHPYIQVQAFLETLDEKMKGNQAQDALRLLEEVSNQSEVIHG